MVHRAGAHCRAPALSSGRCRGARTHAARHPGQSQLYMSNSDLLHFEALLTADIATAVAAYLLSLSLKSFND
jgi:hypothetical protein